MPLLLGHVNKIPCFSSFCLQKFGEGGGYLFRGQRSDATIFTGVKLGFKGKTGTKKSESEQKKNVFNLSMDVRMLTAELHFQMNRSCNFQFKLGVTC